MGRPEEGVPHLQGLLAAMDEPKRRGSRQRRHQHPVARPRQPRLQVELGLTKAGESPNNISCIIKYSLNVGATILWMGDLETDFMAKIVDEVEFPPVDILFAPHHGRDTPPNEWLDAMQPQIVVIREGPSEHQDPYTGYNKLRQNSAEDIVFESRKGKTHVYVSNPDYSVDFLDDERLPDTYGTYIGSLTT
jgi:hypothetical protein